MPVIIRSLLAAALLALVAPAAASAKAPPKGDYTCTFYNGTSSQFSGTLNIVSASKYSVNKGKKGKYMRKGAKLTFKTGDYRNLWTGKYKRTDGQDIIELFFVENGENGPTCTRARK